MKLSGTLDLRDMAAAKHEMTGVRGRFAHVPLEARGHEAVVRAPDEERRQRELAQAAPEVRRLLQVDLAGGGIEGGAAARGQIRAQELVDAGRRVTRAPAGDEALDELLDDRARRGLEEPELRPQKPEPRGPA